MVLGLTGQTGAGKTTVSQLFARNGFEVIDADQIARQVVEPGSHCLEQLAQQFGDSMVRPDGTLDRKRLGNLVFSDREALQQLNAIMNPCILAEIREQLERSQSRWILLDAPTLFESGANVLCTWVVSVLAPESIRKQRIMKRDQLSQQQAEQRIRSQQDDSFYRDRSQAVLVNDGSLSQLKLQTLQLINRIKYESRW